FRLWRVAHGRELRLVRHWNGTQPEPIGAAVLHADGQILATGGQNGLRFFDVTNGRLMASVPTRRDSWTYDRSFDRSDGWMTKHNNVVWLWPANEETDRPGVLHIGPPQPFASVDYDGADASLDGRIRAIPQGSHALVLDRERPQRHISLRPQYNIRFCGV